MTWSEPQFPLACPQGNDIHLWKFELTCHPTVFSRLYESLDRSERERANRYRFDRDRNSFTISRGVLRSLLAHYLNDSPSRISFQYGSHGKPALDSQHSCHLQFNLSHSKQLVLLAFSWERDVGIDIECHRTISDWQGIAKRYFSSAEQQVMFDLPRKQQELAFFNCWTRKEAYIKALGTGLSIPLSQFDVSVDPGKSAQLLNATETDTKTWSMADVDAQSGYSAAVVAEGKGLNISRWTLTVDRIHPALA